MEFSGYCCTLKILLFSINRDHGICPVRNVDLFAITKNFAFPKKFYIIKLYKSLKIWNVIQTNKMVFKTSVKISMVFVNGCLSFPSVYLIHKSLVFVAAVHNTIVTVP